ncbi:hypothetical protein GUJ93_ZPchr0008g12886 [Zizania palustris]|uniref:Uncharacterized protein n=1 Tax=Zizania palustris TaxID=103762 RepID=A0A8J5R4J8_ZIZPA|nr:hypothetical protein GUJ93_ZPchr0008g12886 [Zizania palustris]
MQDIPLYKDDTRTSPPGWNQAVFLIPGAACLSGVLGTAPPTATGVHCKPGQSSTSSSQCSLTEEMNSHRAKPP